MDQNTTISAPPGSQTRRKADNNFSVMRALQTVLSVALLMATLFTLFTPASLFSNDMMERMVAAMQPVKTEAVQPTPTSSPRPRIGLVAGHWGNDSGAVCGDGLTEESVNVTITSMVQDLLVREGFEVDVLKEFDERLTGYRALALVSIHNDSCDYINDEATGFKVAASMDTHDVNRATRLTACLTDRYEHSTGLAFHTGSITGDMREYHAFSEIDPSTTTAIIETGFLNLDRDILTNRTDLVANGIVQGIVCFVNNESVEPTPIPTFAP